MAVRTDAVDRLLEALSPTLSAELDRVVAETKEALDAEFQKRLDAAVRDAQAAVQRESDGKLREAEARLRAAVAEAQDAVRRQVTEELTHELEVKLEESSNQFKKFQEAAQEASNRLKSEWDTERSRFDADRARLESERSRLQEQHDQWRTFAEAQRQLAEASSQSEILVRFLKLAEPYAAGLAVYVTKADGLALWKNRGKNVFPEIVSQETIDPEFFFKAISVRGKTVAAVCAAQPYKVEGLSFLVDSMERAVEFFGLKLRTPATKPGGINETTVATSRGANAAAAVATPPTTEDQKTHADARRAARLLISEIKLYNEQELKAGRDNSDIYQRLQKQIDHGREVYNQQVSRAVLTTRDYFHEELVRILTENDPTRLGEAYPGPMNS